MSKKKSSLANSTSRTRGAKKSRPAAADGSAALPTKLAKLDRQLMKLANERAAATAELAKLQQESGTADAPVIAAGTAWNPQLARIVEGNTGPLSNQAVAAMFRELLSGCRQLANPVRVAFLGPLHSYSHLAALEYFGSEAELVPVASIAAVFAEVTNRQVAYGIVPLENSTDGRIADTLDMFARVRVRISGEVPLRIHHNLLGIGKRTDVETICSKPQALSQCRAWLAVNMPEVTIVETSSTTAAAERASADRRVAAVASRQAAANYGLSVLAENIEDNKENITRFAVIGQESARRTGSDKTSLLFQVAHEPGALADVMAVFKRNRLNLTWIESFPLPGRTQEYLFFVEMQGHERDLRVRRALTALEKKTQLLEVLGAYPIATPVG
ncbi:MAG: prephenate dehydratase [Planctomycetales bacterium]|nr:prephenate dehydratase [Planctomycetales bacterium]